MRFRSCPAAAGTSSTLPACGPGWRSTTRAPPAGEAPLHAALPVANAVGAQAGTGTSLPEAFHLVQDCLQPLLKGHAPLYRDPSRPIAAPAVGAGTSCPQTTGATSTARRESGRRMRSAAARPMPSLITSFCTFEATSSAAGRYGWLVALHMLIVELASRPSPCALCCGAVRCLHVAQLVAADHHSLPVIKHTDCFASSAMHVHHKETVICVLNMHPYAYVVLVDCKIPVTGQSMKQGGVGQRRLHAPHELLMSTRPRTCISGHSNL